MTAPNHGGYRCLCPACGEPMFIRKSEKQTPTFQTMYGRCNNLVCGASYVGSLTWDYTLSPSGLPNPQATLPLSPAKERLQAMRDLAPSANKDQLTFLEQLDQERHHVPNASHPTFSWPSSNLGALAMTRVR